MTANWLKERLPEWAPLLSRKISSRVVESKLEAVIDFSYNQLSSL
ncbi:hypothetical protein HMPREF9439_00023 [Parasutterella excrementihominis YIT 11859]|uniref:Uncharacterized protein n=2 Tax=root TaxID=1 RepID=F3QGI4_9BURK|nr:hypothetical protein HMPREF9439_00023 [Parasutterella excrementihominis YIT 11859]DAF60968.1 MAG TPA: lysozyme [Podoviridae sp. ctlMy11]